MEADLSKQLKHLRRRIRRIERAKPRPLASPQNLANPQNPANGFPRYIQDWPQAKPPPAHLIDDMPLGNPEHYDAEKLLDGEVRENDHGTYFLSERLYPSHGRHGSMEISHLAELPPDYLLGISRDKIPATEPGSWAFLDTETTGLAGGTGTCAFLVGIGTIDEDGFRVRLFFMRDYDEEAAMLMAISEFLSSYDVLVTYNGKAYDSPLLETRYRLSRQKFPLERMHHLDLLHGARRLWKQRLESCRLVDLEYEILGVERQGDLPGELIPYYYFEYLKTRQAFRLVPLLHHNVIDIVSLACLTAVVLPAFASPVEADPRHGADLMGLARWLQRNGEDETALELYRRAIGKHMNEDCLYSALWESAMLEKRRGNRETMVGMLSDITEVRNAHQLSAFEELAKHYEHHEKNYRQALAMTDAAVAIGSSPELLHRRSRLSSRLDRLQEGQAASELF